MSLFSITEAICPSPLRPILNRVKSSQIGSRIASGAFWSVFGNGLAGVLGFLSLILVARILGKELYGEFGLIRSTAMTFVAFSSLGMGLTVTRYIAALLHTDKERVGRIIGLSYLFTLATSLLVSVLFYFAVPWLCETQLNAPHLTNVMKLGAVMLFISTIASTQTCVMQGFQDFRGLAIASVVGGIVMLPLYVAGAWYGGVWGAVICSLIALGINAAINSAMIYRNTKLHQVRYSFFAVRKELPILWQSNLPLFLSGVVYAVGIWLSQLMLATLPNGRAELGIYFAVMNYQMIMLFFTQRIQSVFFPMLSELAVEGKERQYWRVVWKGSLLNFAVAGVCATPFLMFSKFFMGLNGEEYTVGWTALMISAIVVLVTVLPNTCYQVLVSRGLNWTQAVIVVVGKVIFLVAVWYFLCVVGGAVALFCAHIVSGLCYFVMTAFTLGVWKKQIVKR